MKVKTFYTIDIVENDTCEALLQSSFQLEKHTLFCVVAW
jgi:hypothetical protein